MAVPLSDIGVGSWPARRARILPEAIAFRQGERSFTYAQTAARIDALAATLRGLGVQRGDRIGYLGPNDIATFEAFFASGRLGAIFVPLNTRLAATEISYMLADSGCGTLVYGAGSADLVAAADPSTAGVAHLISVDPGSAPGGLDYETLLSAAGPFDPVDVGLSDDAMILYTSGTTGRPKGAILSHGNITFNTINQVAHIDVLSSDVVLCTAPLFHVTGLGQVSLPTLFKGGTLVMAPKFDPAWLLDTIAALQITAFSAVPTMLQLMCDHPGFVTADLSSLRYINYGGSPVLARVAQAWLERGVLLLHGYGMTEAAPGVFLAVAQGARQRPISAGVPQFFTDLALVGPDGPVAASPGSGELLVRGPNVFRGYWNKPAESAAAMTEDWFHTGDVVRIEDDGWAYVVDRVKDMIISGGENIYPAEVEAVLADMPEISDCAVIAVPDETWGEVGMAFVIPADGQTVTAAQVQAFAQGRLAKYKIPKYVQVTDSLPRTATGKVRKSELHR